MKSLAAILVLAASAAAQQPTPPDQTPASQNQTAPNPSPEQPQPQSQPAAQPSIATVSLEGVSLTGSISVEEGRGIIGNNGAITAGERTAHVTLTRGGSLSVCASTKIHLSTDNTISGGGLMIAIDHGALEAHYLPGQYSDVLLTPPGQVDLSLRVNNQGDTCIDNHGDHAPYVLASSLFEGGAYRVQPNQRVLFEHGSLQQVVDNEKESCGCPPPEPIPTPTSIAGIGGVGTTLRSSDQATPPPPPTAAAQNPFPLAESEGLQPPPAPPSTPIVPPGEAHAQVTAPLAYNGENPDPLPPPPAAPPPAPAAPAACNNDPLFPGVVCDSTKSPAGAAPASKPACGDPLYPGLVCDSDSSATPPSSPPNAQSGPVKAKKPSHGIGRFFRKLFGRS